MKALRVLEKARRESSGPVRLEPVEENPAAALLAWLMDTAFVIPGTKIRFGLDALIGLFPGVGDGIGALISSVIIAQGAKLGVPRIVLARMAGNVLINSVVGAVPLFGDIFSVYFRSNVKNYDLLRRHAGRGLSSTAADWTFVAGLILLMLAVVASIVVGTVMLIRNFPERRQP